MAPVSGTVTYKVALPEGKIVFQHPTGEMAAATFGPDGKYEVQVAQGANKVLVTSLESNIQEDAPTAMIEMYTNRIPDRYSNFATSGLEIDVKEGPNAFDVKLEDKKPE